MPSTIYKSSVEGFGIAYTEAAQYGVPSIGGICGNENDLDGRIVVLRKPDRANNLVQYHSDIRSDKIEKLKANKNAAMLFYVDQSLIDQKYNIRRERLLIHHQ